ncbi:Mitochondrial Rho GTPase [Carpediemonas membranifera]|uniref:Mitochondrial Rho GTPase n=1 Tax=Carpediemonas membranifera TaxID=201153 RepID=A0A8J6AZ03_9EUKA|nr:Mitochondrial Rho GTPase [Carpediemonas membranifera]|eukprot:KAG9394890.1 Mitochondrial Rho GTPase [Carpediemonas membranifera]
MESDRTIKIPVIGSPGCGKTCFVLSTITDDPDMLDKAPSRAPALHLPLDHMGLELIPGLRLDLIDTNAEMNGTELHGLLASSDGLIFMASAPELMESIEGVKDRLSRIIATFPKLPVCVVCSKSDLIATPEQHEQVTETMMQLLQSYPEIEQCIEASAVSHQRITETLYCAVRMAALPLGPLFNAEDESLTPELKRVLSWVFTAFDADHDGYWSDPELVHFQTVITREPLNEDDLQGIKTVVSQVCPEGVVAEGEHQGKMTVAGFQTLNLLLLKKNQVDSVWRTLDSCGFGVDLGMKDSYIGVRSLFIHGRKQLKMPPNDKVDRLLRSHGVDPNVTFDLTAAGIDFVTKLFDSFNCDTVGPEAVTAFFPLANFLEHHYGPRDYTKEEWIAHWRALVCVFPGDAIRALHSVVVGRPLTKGPADSLAKVHSLFKPVRRRATASDREVWHVSVVAPKGLETLARDEFAVSRTTAVVLRTAHGTVCLTTLRPDELKTGSGHVSSLGLDAVLAVVEGEDAASLGDIMEVAKSYGLRCAVMTVSPAAPELAAVAGGSFVGDADNDCTAATEAVLGGLKTLPVRDNVTPILLGTGAAGAVGVAAAGAAVLGVGLVAFGAFAMANRRRR